MSVAFFGVWSPQRLGHFIYDASGRQLNAFGPFIPESLDGVLLRSGHRMPGQVDLTCFAQHTVISFVDQSADQRPGSNASFIVEGYALSRQDCWKAATATFPVIVERLRRSGQVRMNDP